MLRRPRFPKCPASYNEWGRIKDYPYANETPFNPLWIFNPYQADDEKRWQDQRDAGASERARLKAKSERLLVESAGLKGNEKPLTLWPLVMTQKDQLETIRRSNY